MQNYIDLLQHILDHGTDKTDRTGTGTRSVFGYQLRYDLSKGFPLITTKKVHLKSIIYELLWFLKGDTNIKEDIADNFSKRQFHRQYKFFREGKIPDGHSIEDFDFLQPGTITELHMFGIHTLEQVADMDEVACEQLKDQPGFEIRDIARQWLKINSPDGLAGKTDRMQIENERLKRELADLKAKNRGQRLVETMQAPVEEIESEPVATMEISPEQLKSRKRKV